ncbi:MAG: hypothetical protein ACRD2W_20955 [Acidimicrobiales bacterium]
MAFFERAAEFLTDRVAPRLVIGHGPRNGPTRAELEAQAERELQARIDLGRPGPEESVRRGPVPEGAVPRRRPTRPLDVVTVRLDVLGGSAQAAVPDGGAGAPALARSRRARLTREAPSA